MKARRSIRSPRRRQYPGSHPRSSHPPSPMYVLMVSPTPACRVAEGRAASNIWSRLGRVCGTNHTDRGCRDGGHFEIEHIRIGDGEMDPACGKSLLRQSSTAMDRFRIRHRPFGLGRGNGSSCPRAVIEPGRWRSLTSRYLPIAFGFVVFQSSFGETLFDPPDHQVKHLRIAAQFEAS